jgi:hypothetical protein
MRYLDGELPFALSELVELLIGQVCPLLHCSIASN